MNPRSFCLLICLTSTGFLYGQVDANPVEEDSILFYDIHTKTHLALILGYYGRKQPFAEIGIGWKESGVVGHHLQTTVIGAGAELGLSTIQQEPIWGIKVGACMSGGVAPANLGIQCVRYTNFEEANTYLRPEIGVGVGFFRLVYGHNFRLGKENPLGIPSNIVGLNLFLNLKKIKEKRQMFRDTD